MATTTAIRGFQGEHRWLSNFWECWLVDPKTGTEFRSVEHAFQWAKFTGVDTPEAAELRRQIPLTTAGNAKRLARTHPCRPDWNAIRVEVMTRLLRRKFRPGSHLAEKLLATGGADLVEDNTWGDTFWGICRGEGLNTLGKLLMQVRDELREGLQNRLDSNWRSLQRTGIGDW